MNLDKNNVIPQLEALQQEVAELKIQKAAFEVQKELLEHLMRMARCSACNEMLKATLQDTLHVSCKLSGADKGSLFLLNSSGVVIESILTQAEVAQEVRISLIGSVLDKGLAGWVFRYRQTGLIFDTETDDRWLILPNQLYVVRSALAIPILRNEELLGILTLLHQEPRQFSHATAKLMEVTAHQIALILENAQFYWQLKESYRSLDKTKQALNSELEKGRQIQKDFLPSVIPKLPNWEIAACFYPARQVAGDFYDTFMLPGNYLGLVIADVCDKGVGAALFMALFRSLIRVFSGQTHLEGLSIIGKDERLNGLIDPLVTTDLNQINALKAVALTNNYIAQEHGDMNMFATLFFGVLNPANGCLTYINAGHEPLFIVGDFGVKQYLKTTGPAVGIMPNMKFNIQQVYLEPGDILIGYTDGVTEARAPSLEFFTTKRLVSLLKRPASSVCDLLEHIKTNLFTHIDNAQQFDDITMLVVGRTPIN